ncbi:TOM (translocase of outer membrane) complex component [Tieghemiomyces parasiticus]|uniref:TOM (Translocase of outer membrane) complex component n=1 Tax=Tieghemiomyces parasiticus TaxID=78921 RepID=A0A9W7ZTB8_9FUNG|nr:TOM (translocase of outer membrane) complex component [Tieghemiomyces parasiticus]
MAPPPTHPAVPSLSADQIARTADRLNLNAADPVPARAPTGGLKSLLDNRDWKFYLAVTLPPLVIASLGLWYYTSSSSKGSGGSTKKKGKGKRRPRPSSSSGTAPAAKPEVDTKAEATTETESSAEADVTTGKVLDPTQLTDAEIEALSEAQRREYATGIKSKGNKFFSGRKYEKAIELYTQALRFVKDPVFYANRAAGYNELDRPRDTVADCDAALALDPTYVKALVRRATAHEKLGDLRPAMEDLTEACILDEFKNNVASSALERVVGKYSQDEAEKIFANRQPHFQSASLIRGFFTNFRPDPALASPPADLDALPAGPRAFWQAQAYLTAEDYPAALEHVETALREGELGDLEAKALTLRGTLHILRGDVEPALADLDAAIAADPTDLTPHLRKANFYIERRSMLEAVAAVEAAEKVTGADPTEVHFQKGQVFFFTNNFRDAINSFDEAIKHDPDFVTAYIQKGVSQYKAGEVASAQATFEEAIERFPDNADVHNYFAEVFIDQGKVDQGMAQLDQATTKDPRHALVWVNKALASLHYKEDVEASSAAIARALEIDPQCELAVAAASQIYHQSARFEEAFKYLDELTRLSRSKEEVASTIGVRESTRMQLQILQKNPRLLAKLSGGGM